VAFVRLWPREGTLEQRYLKVVFVVVVVVGGGGGSNSSRKLRVPPFLNR
jgi:hypothetical protein